MATETNPQPGAQPGDDVPTLKRYQVDITLDRVLAALAEKPRALMQAPSGQPAAPSLHPDVAAHLQRIGDLAGQLQQEISAIRQIDPDVLNRLKQA